MTTNRVLFGTIYSGGSSNLGTVFRINKDGTGFQVLHHFTGGSDSKNPSGDPIVGSDGAVYGVTYFGDSATRGTVYKLDQNGSNYMVIHTFTGTPDGQQPAGRLLQAADGLFYGTTVFGGIASQLGTIYQLNSDGSSYQVIHALQSSPLEGRGPNAGLWQATNGMLYGTVTYGGSANAGAVFTVSTDGNTYNLVRSFQTTGGDGQNPNTELVGTGDGFLYGGTGAGGNGGGSFFRMKADGSQYAVLRAFSSTGTDFYTPNSLTKQRDGSLCGTMRYGGGAGAGCIFSLTPSPPSPRILSLTVSGNSNLVQCAGTSETQYDVDRSTNLSSWSTVTNITAPPNGAFSYSD